MTGRLGVPALILAIIMTASCALLPNAPAVKDDDADVIRYVDWIEVDDLPPNGDISFPLDTDFHETAVKILDGSLPDRLFVAVWHNECPPLVRISSFLAEPAGLGLTVEINDSRRRDCGDILRAWIVDVHLEEETDLDLVFLSCEDNRTR